jgi:hypothetical protein
VLVVVILRNRWIALLLGVVVGALAGVAVYQGSRMSGQPLYILAGGTAGLVTAAVVSAYNRSVQLTAIKVTIPQLSELSFTVTRDSQQVAWKLFVEAVTRVSTQALPSDNGSLREAMTSMYNLFDITRTVLKQAQPSRVRGNGPTVEHLAIALLNNELRPFLSRWHPELQRWEAGHKDGAEGDWPFNVLCRADLTVVQQQLVTYVLGFAKLAGFDEESATAILHGRLAPVEADGTTDAISGADLRIPSQPSAT